MTLNEKYKLAGKDFIPVYGFLKYLRRVTPAEINNELNLMDTLKVNAIQCGLVVYNMTVIGAVTVGAMAATLGIEKLLE